MTKPTRSYKALYHNVWRSAIFLSGGASFIFVCAIFIGHRIPSPDERDMVALLLAWPVVYIWLCASSLYHGAFDKRIPPQPIGLKPSVTSQGLTEQRKEMERRIYEAVTDFREATGLVPEVTVTNVIGTATGGKVWHHTTVTSKIKID